jgi:UDP-N-acetylglucosamine 2-epimerase (non-hydrolysing)
MTASRHPLLLHVVGARPNFMKIAPLLREARRQATFENVLVHTGQHYDDGMSASFFRDLEIPDPDEYLGVGSGTHAEQTARVLVEVERVICRRRPDILVVVGDVNSTLSAALAGAKLGVRVAHVEAGLRSGDRSMPEELNRILTDQLSDFCLTPSRDADENLRREGIANGRVHFVGNIMIDSLLHSLERARALPLREQLGVTRGKYLLATLHRPSNVDDPEQLEEILSALRTLALEYPVLFPVHPRTRERMAAFGVGADGIRILEPVGYLEMLHLQESAALVLTDSGGMQEETTVLGVPCLTLRTTTERPVTVTHGTNRLVPDRRRGSILSAAHEALAGDCTSRRPEGWDGHAADRIVRVLSDALA